MRPTNPLILSIGIHCALFALFVGAMGIVYKNIPIAPEKIKLKIVMQSPESVLARPETPSSPAITKKEESVPVPKTLSTTPSPKIPVIPMNKPNVTPPPVFSEPVTPIIVPKTPEPSPNIAQKTPVLKIEENYAEENLGKIRIILAERLKYPRNALRLNQQGETIVSFTLGTSREVSQITITQSSGFEFLDDAARKLIETSASEFPKPSKPVRISVPIEYKLR